MDEVVRGFLSIGGWIRFFDIAKDTYHVTTLKVLNAIDNELYIVFSIFLGLYDNEFIMTEDYDHLLIDYPYGKMVARV